MNPVQRYYNANINHIPYLEWLERRVAISLINQWLDINEFTPMEGETIWIRNGGNTTKAKYLTKNTAITYGGTEVEFTYWTEEDFENSINRYFSGDYE